MLQGVHAETIVFTSYHQARSLLLAGGWPFIGTTGEFGGRDVKLRASRPRQFRVRVADLRESSKEISSRLELHDGERLFAPLMKIQLSFVPDGSKTRVRLTGSTVRDLSPASPMQEAMSRALANEYARAVIEEIAKAMEVRAASSPAADPAMARPGTLRQKRR